MFPTLIRRMAKEPVTRRVPLTIATNTYKARKVWPPDFKDLNTQQQLRFEKKWKRRLALASRSPRWIKGIKYAQLVTIAGQFRCIAVVLGSQVDKILAALIWLCFYAEFEWWGRKYKPSEEVRPLSFCLSFQVANQCPATPQSHVFVWRPRPR